jgi:hypothetical protein
MPKKTEHAEEKTEAEMDDAGGPPATVDAGEASIVFSRKLLPGVLRFVCTRRDQLTALAVSRHFARCARSLPGHRQVFAERLLRAFGGDGGAPRWARVRADEDPRAALVDMCRECQALAGKEARARRVVLQLPTHVLYSVHSWKDDVVEAAEELGQRCFMRWDLIDQVGNPEEIVYKFKYVAGNVFFSAENKAASRIGVTSSLCKMWLKVDVPAAAGGGGVVEGKTEKISNGEDKAAEEEYEGKKEEYMKTIAVIDGDAFDSYCSWRKKTASRQARVMPSGTFDGSIEFMCLPGVGPEGNASVTYQRRA